MFKIELNKDKGKLKREIVVKKKELAQDVKKEHETNLMKIEKYREKDRVINEKKREEINKIEKQMQESIKKTVKKKAEIIRASQEKEFLNVIKELKQKEREAKKMDKMLKDTQNNSDFYDSFEKSLIAKLDAVTSPKNTRKSKKGDNAIKMRPSLSTTVDVSTHIMY